MKTRDFPDLSIKVLLIFGGTCLVTGYLIGKLLPDSKRIDALEKELEEQKKRNEVVDQKLLAHDKQIKYVHDQNVQQGLEHINTQVVVVNLDKMIDKICGDLQKNDAENQKVSLAMKYVYLLGAKHQSQHSKTHIDTQTIDGFLQLLQKEIDQNLVKQLIENHPLLGDEYLSNSSVSLVAENNIENNNNE